MEKNLYSYKVELMIHVFADNEEEAMNLLEQNQGNMTAKKITLIKTSPIINEL